MTSQAEHRKRAFFEVGNEGFGTYDVKDEFLHPEENRLAEHVSTLENQYFGITAPQHNIHGLMYLTCHPNLKVISGGVWVWQGFKPHWLSSEIFDWHEFMSEDALSNDLGDYTLNNGLRSQMLEPGKRFRVSYEDPARENKIDIEYEAAMPPVMFSSNLHFEQGMKTKGEVVLRGKRYEVDWYTVRDRSWGQPREETLQNIPTCTWMSGCFDDNTFFNCTAFDHPKHVKKWKGVIDIPAENAFKAGWIHVNGENILLVDCVKKTIHNPDNLYPERIELEMTDANGDVHVINGDAVAGCRLNTWKNMMNPVCLMEWKYDGKTGYGDAQDIQSSNLIYNHLKSL